MSPTGLRGFLDGAEPYTPTQRKLEQWYTTAGGGAVGPGSARTALDVLLRELPPAERRDGVARIVEALEEVYTRGGRTAPVWLDELRERGSD